VFWQELLHLPLPHCLDPSCQKFFRKMAKPMTVPEDEALKYFRLKNILTPPALLELSDLDREMSDILSRGDLNPQDKARQYQKALVKFQNLFQDTFTSTPNLKVESPDKKIEEKTEIIPIPPPQAFSLEESEYDQPERVIEDEDRTIAEISMNEEAQAKEPTLRTKAKKIATSLTSKEIIVQKKKKGKNYVAIFDYDRQAFKNIAEDLFVKVLNYLTSSSSAKAPLWGNKKRPKTVKLIASAILKNKVLGKKELENYPNLSHVVENMSSHPSSPQSYSPAKPRPPSLNASFLSSDYTDAYEDIPDSQQPSSSNLQGLGIRVHFNKWNKTIHGT